MHLRLPLVAGVVAIAAASALVRAHTAAAPSAAALVIATAPALPAASVRRRPPPRTPVGTIVVYVAGDVVHAGLYTLPQRSRAADAVRAAGGARPDADLVALNLAAPLADGDEVAVVSKSEAPARGSAHRRTRRNVARVMTDGAASVQHRKKRHARKRSAGAADPTGAGADATRDAPMDVVDLNRADTSELESLPGIGAALAERIVAVREASGPFASADDLLDVGGMTQGRLDAVLPYVTVR